MWIVVTCAAVVGLVLVASVLHLYLRSQSVNIEEARGSFGEWRAALEAEYMKLGSQSGMPRGLAWVSGDFGDDAEFARDKKSKQVFAFVSVSLKFEAIEGGDMEDVAAVANEKAATAVFCYNGKEWKATGKTVFNHNPIETIQHYQHELEAIS